MITTLPDEPPRNTGPLTVLQFLDDLEDFLEWLLKNTATEEDLYFEEWCDEVSFEGGRLVFHWEKSFCSCWEKSFCSCCGADTFEKEIPLDEVDFMYKLYKAEEEE